MLKDAVIDPTGKYRYSLSRIWNKFMDKHLVFVMLNPSTADAENDDPTIRRCIGFAKDWGYGSLTVVNLFSYRATNPNELLNCKNRIGDENDRHIISAAKDASKIVFGWGTKGTLLNRNKYVANLLNEFKPVCLDKTKEGHPKHLLYVKADIVPKLFG